MAPVPKHGELQPYPSSKSPHKPSSDTETSERYLLDKAVVDRHFGLVKVLNKEPAHLPSAFVRTLIRNSVTRAATAGSLSFLTANAGKPLRVEVESWPTI